MVAEAVHINLVGRERHQGIGMGEVEAPDFFTIGFGGEKIGYAFEHLGQWVGNGLNVILEGGVVDKSLTFHAR
ncbi:MAG: hypothetical protein OQK00_07905 [Rhodobacteraceae bacterium]|nr:hypothetical protein [Paracoccaceae bacterium]